MQVHLQKSFLTHKSMECGQLLKCLVASCIMESLISGKDSAFSVFPCIHTCSEAYSAICLMGSEALC